MTTVVIFAGGEPVPDAVGPQIPFGAYLIAADSGLDHAATLGYDVDLLVGDLDSVNPDTLATSRARVERHSPDKDATDLDLALQAALRRQPDRILVVGGQGGRFDHLVGTISLLTSARWSAVELEWIAAGARVRVIRDRSIFHGEPGTIVSLIAVDGPATGVTSMGLHWNLTDATLRPGSTLGISNRFEEPEATVDLAEGTLLAVQPDWA